MAGLVGQEAPEFKVDAVKGTDILENYGLGQFRGKKYVVLFFYPMDFTFVCPTELHEFQAKLSQFHGLNAEVIGASTDSAHSHLAWLRTPKSEGGIQGVAYPILADFNKTVATAFGVLLPGGMALRATFLIDKAGVVQSQHVNNLPLGRNVDESLRLLQALQYTEKHGEVCPANWKTGDEGMQTSAAGLKKFFK